ncbi:efflux RND transporter periplasmic adaptor subunit [Candidatus Zixiibacteriota bacterium]
MKKLTRNRIVQIGSVLVLLLVILASGMFKDKYKDLRFTEATEGEFILDVIVRGELLSERSRSIVAPPGRGNLQLVWLVEEGIYVEAGDVVARIDESSMLTQREQRELQVENAQSNLDNFLANKPNQIRSAESSLQTAGYDLELAEIRLGLAEFESVQQQAQRQLSYENALLNVDEAERSLASLINKLEVDEMRQRTRIRDAQQRLDDVNQQIEEYTLRAPISGIVVYGETFGGNTEGMRKIRAGDSLHRSGTIITIPDLSEMLSKINIIEGDYRKVEVGDPVEIRLDAIPGPVFTGKIDEIAALASYDEMAKKSYFNAVVRLDSVDTGMRPGMTASLRITYEKRENALYIPSEAVFEIDGRTVVFPRKDLPEPREVRLGDRNMMSVVVLEGLEAGEEIALTDPRTLDARSGTGSPVPGGASSGQKNRSQPTAPPPPASSGRGGR